MPQADRAGMLPPSDTTGSVPIREGRVSDVVRCESVPNSRMCCDNRAWDVCVAKMRRGELFGEYQRFVMGI